MSQPPNPPRGAPPAPVRAAAVRASPDLGPGTPGGGVPVGGGNPGGGTAGAATAIAVTAVVSSSRRSWGCSSSAAATRTRTSPADRRPGASILAGQSPETLGNDRELDALAEACSEDDWSACDELYYSGEAGSAYGSYGDTCGGRNEPAGFCTTICD